MTAVAILALARPCLAQLPVIGDAGDNAPLAAADEQAIQQAIVDLSSRSFLVREKASQTLWNAGAAAQRALEKVETESDDLEAVSRARQILASFRLGIYPDTPRAMVDVIRRFQLGSFAIKIQAAQELANSGRRDLLRRLIDQEPSRAVREQLSRFVPPPPSSIRTAPAPAPPAGTVSDDARSRLSERDYDGAERILRSPVSDAASRDLAAFLLTRNKLDPEIARVRGFNPNAAQSRKLAWLLRAKGDLPGAIAAAKAAKDDALAQRLMAEACDWRGLAALDEKADVAALASSPEGAGRIARIIVLRRLAGDEAGCDSAIAAAVKAAEANAIQSQLLLKPLLLTGRVDTCIDLLGGGSPQLALELLAAQDRMKEALRLAKVEVPSGTKGTVPISRPGPTNGQSDDSRSSGKSPKIDWAAWLKANHAGPILEKVWFLAHVARVLQATGETENARALLAAAADSLLQDGASDRRAPFAAALVAASIELRQTEATDALAGKLIGKDNDLAEAVLAEMYPGGAAMPLWTARREAKSDEDSLATLKYLRRLLTSKPDATLLEELREAAQLAQRPIVAGTLNMPIQARMEERAGKFLGLAALFHRAGDSATAVRYLRMVNTARIGTKTLIELGDSLADEKQWPLAVRAYQMAWDRDHRSAAALYSLGWAQDKSGNEADGKQNKELALVVPLGDGESRLELIHTLERLHEGDEAARQRQVLLRTADFDSRALVQTLLTIGESAEPPRDGPAPAAALERITMLFVDGNVFLSNARFYLNISYEMHRQRAMAALRAGKTAEAVGELGQAEKIMPRNIQLALDCDALLRKQGAAAEADAMYRRMAGHLQADCRDFPHCAACRNDLAWLAANLDRDLDLALANAQRAVELAPQSAGILDTLAEVQYRRGNRGEAVRLERRCVAMDGDNAQFKDRLAKFEK